MMFNKDLLFGSDIKNDEKMLNILSKNSFYFLL